MRFGKGPVMSHPIQIVEVGPRDGLQNEKTVLTAGEKLDFIARLEAAGVTRIEAVSFVNPVRVPQMADAEAVMAGLAAPHPGRVRIGLALNRRGWDRAVAAGCEEVNLVVCASDGFGIRNQGASVEDQLGGVRQIAALAAAGGPKLSATIAVAFGCPFDGEVPPERVAAIAEVCAGAGLDPLAGFTSPAGHGLQLSPARTDTDGFYVARLRRHSSGPVTARGTRGAASLARPRCARRG